MSCSLRRLAIRQIEKARFLVVRLFISWGCSLSDSEYLYKVSKGNHTSVPYSIESHVVKCRILGVSQGEVQRLVAVVGSVRARGLKYLTLVTLLLRWRCGLTLL